VTPGMSAGGVVLVVDDEAMNRELLHDLLEVRAYTVLAASDGEEGLSIAREQLPDAVLLDVMMPRIDGFEVCRLLKADERTAFIPVLLVTSLDAREDRLKGIEAGANDFITKPIDSADLLLRVRNAVSTKRLYDQVARQYRHLQSLEAARDNLVHMIVHDLRSPLTGLQAYLDLLLMSPAATADGEIQEFAGEAKAIAQRLSQMITQVLDVSRFEAGKMPVAPQLVDLTQLVRAAVATLGPPPSGVKLVYDLPGEPTPAEWDPDLMSRVIANLVGNAYRFSPKGEAVLIALELREGLARVTVSDSGPGVPAEMRSHIFEKFGQVSSAGRGRGASTGLGLTFCKLAVEAHGGWIGVDNAPRRGSTFWIELPVTHGVSPHTVTKSSTPRFADLR
jgi:two-component system, sensor histidine kinase and response regulator